MLLPGFQHQRMASGDVVLHVATAGDGPPLLLLHGFPESHFAWHVVAPQLAERFCVVCPDLRGYGASDKPAGDPEHVAYSKRTMAADVLALMRELGHDRFAVAGHDRGALVGHRLALDHPQVVTALTVMDVLPQVDMWEALVWPFSLAAHHLLLLAQPADYPERLVGASADLFLDHTLDSWCGTPGAIVSEARDAYRKAFRDPATIHAVCEDYRAGATIDVAHDRADRAAGRQIQAPVLIAWQQPEGVDLPFDPVAVWGRWAEDVQGLPLACGHFLPEERPSEVADAIANQSSMRAGWEDRSGLGVVHR